MTPGPGGYAGIVSRGAAFSIDAIVALLVSTVGFQVVVAVFAAVGVGTMWSGDGAAALGYVLALPVVFGVYCAGFWALLGRTPGMMLLGLRVVTIDRGRPGARRSVIRAVGYWVSAIALVGFAWIAVDRRSQGFHDKLAGTYVVYDWGGRRDRLPGSPWRTRPPNHPAGVTTQRARTSIINPQFHTRITGCGNPRIMPGSGRRPQEAT